MQKIFGIILRDSDVEILEDENPAKGSFITLVEAMREAQSRVKQNTNIKQINIYTIKQGQHILDYQIFPEA